MNIKSKVTVKVGRTVLNLKKNSPGLMFGLGIGAMIGTVVLASRATLQLEEVILEAEHNNERPNHKMRTAMKIGELYGPAIVLGSISVGCLTGSHVVLTKRNTALTAAYAALDKTYREYRDRVREEYGDDKERQLNFGIPEKDIVRDVNTGKPISTLSNSGHSVYARFFDEMSQNWSREPEYNRNFLSCQQNYANDMLRSRGHVFLNEVYDWLGIERSKAGAVVGWVLNNDGDNYIDFGIFDGRERARAFVNGQEGAVLLDFNVDGIIFDLIEKGKS